MADVELIIGSRRDVKLPVWFHDVFKDKTANLAFNVAWLVADGNLVETQRCLECKHGAKACLREAGEVNKC